MAVSSSNKSKPSTSEVRPELISLPELFFKGSENELMAFASTKEWELISVTDKTYLFMDERNALLYYRNQSHLYPPLASHEVFFTITLQDKISDNLCTDSISSVSNAVSETVLEVVFKGDENNLMNHAVSKQWITVSNVHDEYLFMDKMAFLNYMQMKCIPCSNHNTDVSGNETALPQMFSQSVTGEEFHHSHGHSGSSNKWRQPSQQQSNQLHADAQGRLWNCHDTEINSHGLWWQSSRATSQSRPIQSLFISITLGE
jgi:translation elongation factor P/translation initiation factor 5A